jgi:hypothetical protein
VFNRKYGESGYSSELTDFDIKQYHEVLERFKEMSNKDSLTLDERKWVELL